MESSTYQKVLVDTTQMYEKKITELTKQLKDEQAHAGIAEEQLDAMKKLQNNSQKTIQVGYAIVIGKDSLSKFTLNLESFLFCHW